MFWVLLGIMVSVVGVMLTFFHHRRWL
jgi:hypothetical protein